MAHPERGRMTKGGTSRAFAPLMRPPFEQQDEGPNASKRPFSLASFALSLLRLSQPPLASGRLPQELPILLDQKRRLATYDAFVDTATVSVAEASAVRRPIALLVADVDHYRRLADEYGDAYAEQALKTIFDLARANLREGELVAHPGGD